MEILTLGFPLQINVLNWLPSIFNILNVCNGYDLLNHQNHMEYSARQPEMLTTER